MSCPWGKKAFTAYLGKDKNTWRNHDASELMRQAKLFVPAKVSGYPLEYRLHDGYDHSYYFISSFMKGTCAFTPHT